jgi:uncharacterized protein YeaO (DUF488 family)
MKIAIKRAYEDPGPEDGYRVRVDRVWPRGRAKDELALEKWAKALAPSAKLRKWFGHDPSRWRTFEERYREELSSPEQRQAAPTGRERQSMIEEFGAVHILIRALGMER